MDGRSPPSRLRGLALTPIALVALLAVLPAGALGQGEDEPAALRIAFLVEEAPWGPAVAEGARDAAAHRGVVLDLVVVSSAPERQADAVEGILDREPGALVVAVADPGGLAASLSSLPAAGIPLVIARHGADAWRSLDAAAFVGQDEAAAGRAAADRFLELGIRHAVCVIDQVGQPILEARCQAATEAMTAAGARMEPLYALDPAADPKGVRDAITTRLLRTPTIEGVLAAEQDALVAAAEARARAGPGRDVVIGGFDRASFDLTPLDPGERAFAIDQQPYLQGYLPILLLSLPQVGALEASSARPLVTGPRVVSPDGSISSEADRP